MSEYTNYEHDIIELIRNEERAERTGWSIDMESAPTDKWLLLQSGSSETRVYLGQLQRLKDGTLQRKISRTPWKGDNDEMFFRDNIVAWFDARTVMDFLHEAYRAALLAQGPVVSCTKQNEDGSLSVAYKKGTVPEYRRFVVLGGPEPEKYKIPEISIQDYVLYWRD